MSAALCSIIPIVGGAIGGAMAVTNLTMMRNAKSLQAKIDVWLGMLVGTFFICFPIAYLILSAI